MSKINLSPSTISLFLKCPHCFWLKINKKIKLPEPPTSSLPLGMDSIIKIYYDSCRQQGLLPDELKGKVRGRLIPDQKLLNGWRNWRTGLRFTDQELQAGLMGALDDCLIDGDVYIPVDYKTRGYSLKENTTSYYIDQLNFYCFLLEENGYKTNSLAYLVFYISHKMPQHGMVNFSIDVKPIKTDIDRAYNIFKNAVKCLRNPLPPFTEFCNYCGWYRTQNDLLSEKDLFD